MSFEISKDWTFTDHRKIERGTFYIKCRDTSDLNLCTFKKHYAPLRTFHLKVLDTHMGVSTFELIIYQRHNLEFIDVKVVSGDIKFSLPRIFFENFVFNVQTLKKVCLT